MEAIMKTPLVVVLLMSRLGLKAVQFMWTCLAWPPSPSP